MTALRRRMTWMVVLFGCLLAAFLSRTAMPLFGSSSGSDFSTMAALSDPPDSALSAARRRTPHRGSPIAEPTAQVDRTAAAPIAVAKFQRHWRPPPAVAERNRDRRRYTWWLRKFGASERTLDRLADGDYAGVFIDMNGLAARGDPSAIRILAWMAPMCAHPRSEETLQAMQASTEEAARDLPTVDAGFVDALAELRTVNQRQLSSACPLIDAALVKTQYQTLVASDVASQYLLALQSSDDTESSRLLAGFPPAQSEYAFAVMRGAAKDVVLPGDPSPAEFLKSAAAVSPEYRAYLALCEYEGCGDADPDIPAALADARSAAAQGFASAMIFFDGKQPLSVVPADEPEAWTLFNAAIEERACVLSSRISRWKDIADTLASPRATPAAQALADQYWQLYGAQALAQLGC